MTTTEQPRVGPIQLIVVGFPPGAEFRGETIKALNELRGRGIIRIIDAMFVRKDAEGRLNANIRESDLSLAEREKMGAIVGGLFGFISSGGDDESTALGATEAVHAIMDNAFGFGVGDLQNIKDQIPAGTAALLLLVEHQWALDLKAAVRGSGGVPLVQGFVTPEALIMVGAEVLAVAEAERTIAVARAAEGAAVLAALATVEASEIIQQAAVAETARVLVAAGLIQAEAIQEVIDTLLAAELIKQEALDEAKAAVLQAEESAQSGANGSARVAVSAGSELT